MTVINDSIVTNFLFGIDELTPALARMTSGISSFSKSLSQARNLTKMNTQLNEVGLTMNKAGQVIDMTTKKLVKYDDAIMKITNKDLDKLKQKQEEVAKKTEMMNNRFNMNALSLMFAGMMLQRFGQTIIRFMIPSMDKLEQLNTIGSKKVMAMGAAWEFLKISMFEAVSSTPMFQELVKLFIKGALWIAELAQKHPEVTALVLAVGGLATAFGTAFLATSFVYQVAYATGAWGKFVLAIKDLFGADGTTGTLSKSVSGFGNLLAGLGTAGAIAFVLSVNWKMLNNEDDARSRFNAVLKGTVGGAIAGALIGAIFGGPAGAALGAGIGAAIGFGITIAVSIYDYIMEDKPTKGDFTKAIKEFFSSWDGYMGAVLATSTLGLSIAIPVLFKAMANTDARIEGENIAQAQIDSTEEFGQKTEEVSQWAVESYSSIFAEQLKSEEQTQKLIENARLFGETVNEVLGGSGKKAGVIGQFNALGEQIIMDNQYFDTLKTDVETWASTVTTKIIEIEYREKNKPSGSPSFLSKAKDFLFAGGD